MQNRAFVELSRILASGDSAVLSSALPVIVRGAGVPSAAAFAAVQGELMFAATESVPLKLRAYLEEPAFTGTPDFLARRALSQRRTLIDPNIFGGSATAGLVTALDDAQWQCGIAVPILAGGSTLGVLLAGSRSGVVDGSAITFLEAAANVIGAALGQPAKKRSLPPPRSAWTCSTCLAHVSESLAALGRELSAQHALLRELGSRAGAPPETDALMRHLRASDRNFRRLAEMILHLPAAPCAHRGRSCAMATAVDSAVLACRPALAAARAEVEVVCAPGCEMEGDPDLIAVAVRHLLLNAAEAFTPAPEHTSIPSSRRHVRICARHEGPNAVLHVEDSGPGVPHDLRSRVFDPSVSTKGPGHGLGLAIARHVVESHGGWMELGASELGGARLSIFFPARSVALDELRKAPTQPQIHVPSGIRRTSRSLG